MCGIGGILEFKNRVKKTTLLKMNKIQKHRGPDANGIWISEDQRMGLTHTRLSILDISKEANQPFIDPKKRYVISFNGEIYNFKEIKETLIKKGYKFRTKNSDTEVLLFAFMEWNTKCLNYLRGMFAFAIWDVKEKKLWLVRDRVGVKPLYYKFDNDKVMFGSEIKSLLVDETYVPEIDEESLFHYLSFLCVPAPNTMFRGIQKLEAGSWILVDKKGKTFKKKYWDPLENKLAFSEVDFNNKVYDAIKESIKYRSVSDVDVGIFLSGGIDSSTNAYLFSEINNQKVNTFSIGYDKEYDSYKSELEYANLVADNIDSNHHEMKLKKEDLTNIIEEMVYHQDEPISDPVCFPIYYVSKLAVKNKIKVCQVGEGADELFFGYTNWARTVKIDNLLKNFFFTDFLKRTILFFAKTFKFDHKYSVDLISRSIKKLPIFWSGAEAFSEIEKKRLLSEKMKKKFSNKSSWKIIKPHYLKFKKLSENSNIENWMTYIDLKLRLPELLLMRIDKMSMATGLEARVPFLDHKLIEKLIDIPKKIKFKDKKLKIILKDCIKSLLPASIINRKKQGFGLPLKEWFSDGLGINEFKDIMNFVEKTNYFDPTEVKKLLTERKDDTRIWFLLNLALWWKVFIKKESHFSLVNSK